MQVYGASIMTASLGTAAHAVAATATAEAATGEIGDALHRLIRSVNRRKAALAADGQDQEWAAHALLEQISASGPLRAAYLADSTATDPSTISRHVASLVKSGLIERRADPIDGRASLLVSTAAGDAIVAKHLQRRNQWLKEMLDPWPEDDLVRFGQLMQNFVTHLERQNAVQVESQKIESQSPALEPAPKGTR
jgi:DNA-binding MarR family transcriptional regulator